jgi:hypothetical protein
MSSIVSTDILFFVLPPSPPAEKATAHQAMANPSRSGMFGSRAGKRSER